MMPFLRIKSRAHYEEAFCFQFTWSFIRHFIVDVVVVSEKIKVANKMNYIDEKDPTPNLNASAYIRVVWRM